MVRGDLSSLFARWRRLDWSERRLRVEALLLLPVSRLVVVALPFRRVARLAGGTRTFPPVAPRDAERMRRAIRAVARRMPFRALCFEQGLTAQLMLRRRRMGGTLYYGVGRGENGALVAHVWVRAGTTDVIGTEGCERFSVLAAFPSLDAQGGEERAAMGAAD